MYFWPWYVGKFPIDSSDNFSSILLLPQLFNQKSFSFITAFQDVLLIRACGHELRVPSRLRSFSRSGGKGTAGTTRYVTR